MLSALGPIRKAGGGGVRGCVLYTSGTIRKAGGLRSRRGGGTLQSIEYIARALQLIINDFRNFNNSSAKIFSYIYRA